MKNISEILNLDFESTKEQCRNPGTDTFNGAKFVELLSRGVVSQAEAEWMWARLLELRAEGMEKDAALAKIKQEAKGTPWLKA